MLENRARGSWNGVRNLRRAHGDDRLTAPFGANVGTVGILAVLAHWKIGQRQLVKMTVWSGLRPRPPAS